MKCHRSCGVRRQDTQLQFPLSHLPLSSTSCTLLTFPGSTTSRLCSLSDTLAYTRGPRRSPAHRCAHHHSRALRTPLAHLGVHDRAGETLAGRAGNKGLATPFRRFSVHSSSLEVPRSVWGCCMTSLPHFLLPVGRRRPWAEACRARGLAEDAGWSRSTRGKENTCKSIGQDSLPSCSKIMGKDSSPFCSARDWGTSL